MKRDTNKHRANKRLFQAWLEPHEYALVDLAKKRVSIKTDKDLIVLFTVEDLLANPIDSR